MMTSIQKGGLCSLQQHVYKREAFILSCKSQSLVVDREQSHLDKENRGVSLIKLGLSM